MKYINKQNFLHVKFKIYKHNIWYIGYMYMYILYMYPHIHICVYEHTIFYTYKYMCVCVCCSHPLLIVWSLIDKWQHIKWLQLMKYWCPTPNNITMKMTLIYINEKTKWHVGSDGEKVTRLYPKQYILSYRLSGFYQVYNL